MQQSIPNGKDFVLPNGYAQLDIVVLGNTKPDNINALWYRQRKIALSILIFSFFTFHLAAVEPVLKDYINKSNPSKKFKYSNEETISGDSLMNENLDSDNENFPLKTGGFLKQTILSVRRSDLDKVDGMGIDPILISYSRLRLGVKLDWKYFQIEGSGNGDFIFANDINSLDFQSRIPPSSRNQLIQGEKFRTRNGHLLGSNLHRLILALDFGIVNIKIGRQAISWGQGRMLNPLDLITPVNPFILDMEDIPGNDTLNINFYLNDTDFLQFVCSANRRNEERDLSKLRIHDSNILLRLKATEKFIDYAVLSGRHYRSWVWGLEFTITKWESNFRISYLGRKDDSYRKDLTRVLDEYGNSLDIVQIALLDSIYLEKQDSKKDFSHQFVLGYSYAFWGKLRTNLEAFINLNPYSKNKKLENLYIWEQLIKLNRTFPLPHDVSYYKTNGRILSKNTLLLELSFGYEINPITTIDFFAIGDIKGKSAFCGPQISLSVSDEGVLVLGGWFFLLPEETNDSEFQGAQDEFFAYIRMHF